MPYGIMTVMATIFEQIIAREIPATIIYEDESVVSFLDIRPANKGHALVVPKHPYVNMFDADSDVLAHMMRVAQKIARAQKAILNADGVNLLMNNGAFAGQEVMHAHLHVIPRFDGDRAVTPPRQTTYLEGEAESLGETIKNAIR